MHAASKATIGEAFAKAMPNKPPGHDAKAKKVATDKRKAVAAATTTTATLTNPPTKK
jgi:hypothetical protein